MKDIDINSTGFFWWAIRGWVIPGYTDNDLIQEAKLVYLTALKKWKRDSGSKTTYMAQCIRHRLSELAAKNKVVFVPDVPDIEDLKNYDDNLMFEVLDEIADNQNGCVFKVMSLYATGMRGSEIAKVLKIKQNRVYYAKGKVKINEQRKRVRKQGKGIGVEVK